MNKNVIVTHRSLSAALDQLDVHPLHVAPSQTEAASELESRRDPGVQTAADALLLSRALRAIEQADIGDGLLSAVPDRLASLLQSRLAEQAEDEESTEDLPDGGLEAKFDRRDLAGWIGSVLSWWRRLVPHDWITPTTQATEIPNKVRIGLLADWGTGLYGAPECAARLAEDFPGFDLLMHLGDVYYSGTPREIRSRFLPYWPASARLGHLALNSNHEMYSGGHGYFGVTLPEFARRSRVVKQSSSCFALRNDYFLLIGLDTGYAEHDLAENQPGWLRTMVAGAEGRKVILFSHHQPYSLFESSGPKLVEKMQGLLDQQRIFAWYWGHEHRLVIHQVHPQWAMHGRCLGHGGMPYFRDELPRAAPHRTALYQVSGREADGIFAPPGRVLDGPNPFIPRHQSVYGPNGFVVLELDGPTLEESFKLADGSEVLQQRLP